LLDMESDGVLILGFSASRSMRNKWLLFKSPSQLYFCYSIQHSLMSKDSRPHTHSHTVKKTIATVSVWLRGWGWQELVCLNSRTNSSVIMKWASWSSLSLST
jgi:hypothetical protein